MKKKANKMNACFINIRMYPYFNDLINSYGMVPISLYFSHNLKRVAVNIHKVPDGYNM